MQYNCLGVPVLADVAAKAEELGCVGGVKYVYQEGEYGKKYPVASIGCRRATRFRSQSYERFKIELIPGWVAFESPSSGSERQTGKGFCEPCVICGEDRWTEEAHFPARKRAPYYGTETIPLCPTHHRLLESGRLSDWEYMEICRRRYAHLGISSVKEFVEWAHSGGYSYSLADLRAKLIRQEYDQARQISYHIENDGGTTLAA